MEGREQGRKDDREEGMKEGKMEGREEGQMEERKRTQEGKWAGLHPSAGRFWPTGRMFDTPALQGQICPSRKEGRKQGKKDGRRREQRKRGGGEEGRKN